MKKEKERKEREALMESRPGATQSLAKQMAVKGMLGTQKMAAEALVEALSDDELSMLRSVEDEFARAAELALQLQLIFPAPNAGIYAPLFETPRYTNVLLLAWLHASRDRRSGAAKKGVGVLLQRPTRPPPATVPGRVSANWARLQAASRARTGMGGRSSSAKGGPGSSKQASRQKQSVGSKSSRARGDAARSTPPARRLSTAPATSIGSPAGSQRSHNPNTSPAAAGGLGGGLGWRPRTSFAPPAEQLEHASPSPMSSPGAQGPWAGGGTGAPGSVPTVEAALAAAASTAPGRGGAGPRVRSAHAQSRLDRAAHAQCVR